VERGTEKVLAAERTSGEAVWMAEQLLAAKMTSPSQSVQPEEMCCGYEGGAFLSLISRRKL
jgi:hypothetical protein